MLSDKHCMPCKGGVPPLKGDALKSLRVQLSPDWQLIDEHHLTKDYRFKNFRDALAFVNRVGAIAEAEGHHPDIAFGWGFVKISLFTHKIDGLTESDFILAAKCDLAL